MEIIVDFPLALHQGASVGQKKPRFASLGPYLAEALRAGAPAASLTFSAEPEFCGCRSIDLPSRADHWGLSWDIPL